VVAWHAVRAFLAGFVLSVAVAISAAAQPELDLNQMALKFTEGAWASPLVCAYEGNAKRGLRRLKISPGSKDLIPPSNHLVIYPMRIPDGIRCFLDTGETQVDIAGSLTFHLEGFSRPDLAPREFQETLERDGGFTFTIQSGALDIGGKRTEFKGGQARFSLPKRGSDSSKRLGDIESPHKLVLALSAPDGTSLSFDLALTRPGVRP
jgi:hypothetical protein